MADAVSICRTCDDIIRRLDSTGRSIFLIKALVKEAQADLDVLFDRLNAMYCVAWAMTASLPTDRGPAFSAAQPIFEALAAVLDSCLHISKKTEKDLGRYHRYKTWRERPWQEAGKPEMEHVGREAVHYHAALEIGLQVLSSVLGFKIRWHRGKDKGELPARDALIIKATETKHSISDLEMPAGLRNMLVAFLDKLVVFATPTSDRPVVFAINLGGREEHKKERRSDLEHKQPPAPASAPAPVPGITRMPTMPRTMSMLSWTSMPALPPSPSLQASAAPSPALSAPSFTAMPSMPSTPPMAFDHPRGVFREHARAVSSPDNHIMATVPQGLGRPGMPGLSADSQTRVRSASSAAAASSAVAWKPSSTPPPRLPYQRKPCPRYDHGMASYIAALKYGDNQRQALARTKAGGNPNFQHQCVVDMPALTVAVLRNDVCLVRALLAAGANVDGQPTNDAGSLPPHQPLYEHLELEARAGPRPVAPYGSIPVNFETIENDSFWLPEVSWADAALCTPLHAAVTARSYQCARDRLTETRWDIRLQIIEELLRAGANVHAPGCAWQRKNQQRPDSGLFCVNPHHEVPVLEALYAAQRTEGRPDQRPLHAIMTMLLEASPVRLSPPSLPEMVLSEATDVAFYMQAKDYVLRMLVHPEPRGPKVWSCVVLRCVENDDWVLLERILQYRSHCRLCYHVIVRAFATGSPVQLTRNQISRATYLFAYSGMNPLAVVPYSFRAQGGTFSSGRQYTDKPISALTLSNAIEFLPKYRKKDDGAFLVGEIAQAAKKFPMNK